MLILQICNLKPLKQGAFERRLAYIATAAASRGHKAIVATAAEPIATVAEAWAKAGLACEVIEGWDDGTVGSSKFIWKSLALVRKYKPDVVTLHFGNELPFLVLIVLTRLLTAARPKWMWAQHQQVSDPQSWKKLFNRLGLLGWFADGFMVQYEGGRRSLIRRGIKGDRIAVIYNGTVNETAGRPAGWLKTAMHIPEEANVIISVSSLIKRKRLDFQIKALSILGESVSAHLVSAGEGGERKYLSDYAKERGVSDRTHFMGLRNDVHDIMGEADILWHTSEAETCTYSITEAMSKGVPAVVTEAGACREQIDDGISGFVCGRDDTNDFIQKTMLLLSDRALREKMGKAAYAKWKKQFCLERTAAQFVDVLESLALDGGINIPRFPG